MAIRKSDTGGIGGWQPMYNRNSVANYHNTPDEQVLAQRNTDKKVARAALTVTCSIAECSGKSLRVARGLGFCKKHLKEAVKTWRER